MDEQPSGPAGDDADPAAAVPLDPKGALASVVEGDSPASEIIDLPWDVDLPVALGEETDLGEDGWVDPVETGSAEAAADNGDETAIGGDDIGGAGVADGEGAEAFDYPEEDEEDDGAGGRRARPRRVDTWRSRTATGAIATAVAMGLQQVFEPEQRRPAAVAEAPSDPYAEDDPITVDYVPDDATATTVHVKPWLLEKGDQT